jgi:hypothetical protein
MQKSRSVQAGPVLQLGSIAQQANKLQDCATLGIETRSQPTATTHDSLLRLEHLPPRPRKQHPYPITPVALLELRFLKGCCMLVM